MSSYFANTGTRVPNNRTALKPACVLPDQMCQVLKRISASGISGQATLLDHMFLPQCKCTVSHPVSLRPCCHCCHTGAVGGIGLWAEAWKMSSRSSLHAVCDVVCETWIPYQLTWFNALRQLCLRSPESSSLWHVKSQEKDVELTKQSQGLKSPQD